MAFEPRDNTGSLFKNNRKEKDTHPNSTGKAMIDGVEYYVSGWTKKDKNGDPWISLSFKKVETKGPDQSGGGSGRLSDQLSDEIPF